MDNWTGREPNRRHGSGVVEEEMDTAADAGTEMAEVASETPKLEIC